MEETTMMIEEATVKAINWGKVGKVAGVAAVVAVGAFGAKKLYDKKKNAKTEEFFEEDVESEVKATEE